MFDTDLRVPIRRFIGGRPRLFFGFYGMRRNYRSLLVGRETRFVIEGFPRSGNTFAVYAFEQAQHRDVRLAHHLHAPAQVIRATDRGIPCLVLIRDPSDAVLSLVIREPQFSLAQAFLQYISFYETISDRRDDYVLGSFDEIITDYGATIKRVNLRFGTDFRPFDHSEENVERVFATIESSHRARRKKVVEEKISRPSSAKEAKKVALREELGTSSIESLARHAQSLFEDLTTPDPSEVTDAERGDSKRGW